MDNMYNFQGVQKIQPRINNTLVDVYKASKIEDQKSVPILFDEQTKTVINDESADILRMMGTVFHPLAKHSDTVHLCPTNLMDMINEINDWIYTDIYSQWCVQGWIFIHFNWHTKPRLQ
jgi:glutathionyl-hydroquinone reductase